MKRTMSIVKMKDILEARVSEIEEKQKRAESELGEQGYTPEIIQEFSAELRAIEGEGATTPRRGMTTSAMSSICRQELVERERKGDFKLTSFTPGAEYPMVLARCNIFPPTRPSIAAEMRDKELSMPFNTGWGEGRVFGPPITVYDEDTLLALAGLRQEALEGRPERMPLPTKSIIPFDSPTRVHCLYVTVAEIEKFLEKKSGGSGHKRRLASVKRLGNVRVEFSRMSDKSVGKKKEFKKTVTISLIDVATVEEGNESFFYVQFPPEMALWLDSSFSYIDLKIRNQLTDNGKVIHKLLSTQSNFNMFTETLRELTKTNLTKKRFMQELRAAMKKLESLGWCEYDILGNGRSEPHKLVGKRT